MPPPRASRHKREKQKELNDLDGLLNAVSDAWNTLTRTTLRKLCGYLWRLNLLT